MANALLPWFILDIGNGQVITSPGGVIPGDITDTKDIILSEQPIPGLPFAPIQSGGLGNRKISFTIDLIKKNNFVGNIAFLKQFDNLRHSRFSFKNIIQQTTQFTQNPKVLYNWGIGSTPLVWYVKKADPVHNSLFVNSFGQPQYSKISIELWLDEQDSINKMEEVFRQVESTIGSIETSIELGNQTIDNIRSLF